MLEISKFFPLWGVWEVEAVLGEGSFGTVYKAVRKEFDRKYECAIKHISLPKSDAELKQLLDEHLSDDKSMISDYYRQIVGDIVNEIDIIRVLQGNTNIVTYEDHKIIPKEDGIGYDIFIRMELLTELSARIKQSEITESDVIKLGIDICNALELCAANKLIHRDIKPQNIFINNAGNYKLGDFGVSRQLEKTASGLSKKGTYSYMAPEVYKGQEYGANVDIYSLGLLMYRLLNGNRLPFLPLAPSPMKYSDNEVALKRRMDGEQIPAPAFASDGLAQIVLKMCAFDRTNRYASAAEVKSDLVSTLNSPQKVVPMVAPIGRDSLTDNSVQGSSASPSDYFKNNQQYAHEQSKAVSEAEKNNLTASMFGGVVPQTPVNNVVANNIKKYCTGCGADISGREGFCVCCGMKIEKSENSVQQSPMTHQFAQTYQQAQTYYPSHAHAQSIGTVGHQVPMKQRDKKKKSNKFAIIGAVAAAVVLIVVLIILIPGGDIDASPPRSTGAPVQDDAPAPPPDAPPPDAPTPAPDPVPPPDDPPPPVANNQLGNPTRGIWEGNVYTNEFIGLQFDMPIGWNVVTGTGLPTILYEGAEITDYVWASLDEPSILDMSINHVRGGNINIVINNAGFPMSAAEFRQAIYDAAHDMEDIGMSVTVGSFDEPTRIGRYYWYYQEVEIELLGEAFIMHQFLKLFNYRYFVAISIGDDIEDSLEDTVAMFSAPGTVS